MVVTGRNVPDSPLDTLLKSSKVSTTRPEHKTDDVKLDIRRTSSIYQDRKCYVNHFNRIPLVVLEPVLPASITTIIGMKERYYLNSAPDLKFSGIDGSVTNICRSLEISRLQELVLQMKRPSGASKYDDSCSIQLTKSTGLPNYCKYLRGQSIV